MYGVFADIVADEGKKGEKEKGDATYSGRIFRSSSAGLVPLEGLAISVHITSFHQQHRISTGPAMRCVQRGGWFHLM